MREQEYRVPRAHGPKVAVIGGGHGLSNMLRGLKQYTENISAIVTVADDGGGSGMLRQERGRAPPRVIRSWEPGGAELWQPVSGGAERHLPVL